MGRNRWFYRQWHENGNLEKIRVSGVRFQSIVRSGRVGFRLKGGVLGENLCGEERICVEGFEGRIERLERERAFEIEF